MGDISVAIHAYKQRIFFISSSELLNFFMNWASNVAYVLLNTYKHYHSETRLISTLFVLMSKPNSYIYTGMAYEVLSFVADIVFFCFEECWIDCLFTIQLKLRKSQSGVFITFDKPLIYFYLIEVNFFVYTVPLAKRRSKISMEETSEDTGDIDFLILNQIELFIEG